MRAWIERLQRRLQWRAECALERKRPQGPPPRTRPTAMWLESHNDWRP